MRTPRPATEPRDGPTQNFDEKYRKNTPQPEILDSQKFGLSPKYPENTETTPKNGRCWYLLGGILGVFSWGSRVSALGVYLGTFSCKFRIGPSRGSVAGQAQVRRRSGALNPNSIFAGGRGEGPSLLFFQDKNPHIKIL